MAIPHGQGTINPNYRPSDLDGNQVLQYAFDEAACRLRVDASVSIGGSEVIIDHADDSIRIGDGTTLATVTTVGPKSGLDVNVINSEVGGVPDVDNVSAPSAGTEYSYNIVTGTKRLTIRSRSGGIIKFAYAPGDSNTTFVTVKPGNTKTIDNIFTNTALTLYFNSSKNADVLEIEYWI